MTLYEESRWLALMECVDLIGDTAEKSGINFETLQLNHPAMMHYVDETSGQIALHLQQSKAAAKHRMSSVMPLAEYIRHNWNSETFHLEDVNY